MSKSDGPGLDHYGRLFKSSLYNSWNFFAGEIATGVMNPHSSFTRRSISSRILHEYSSVLNFIPRAFRLASQNKDEQQKDSAAINVRKAKTPLAETVDSVHASFAQSQQSVKKLPYLDISVSDEVHLGIVNKRSMLTLEDNADGKEPKRHSTMGSINAVTDGSKDNLMSSYLRETKSGGHSIAQLAIKPKAGSIRRRQPKWHPPWKMYRMIVGHQGWVHCVAVDVSNEWFATGSADRMIKIWDLATCQLKLSLTGHINAVRDIKISDRHPYLFSCGEDNTVKCWDIEQNKVVRSYHGHLSGVYTLALHPELDVLFSGGRDAVVRVWDIRTKESIHVLSGHSGTIMSLATQRAEPQVISGSQDKTVRLWDLASGKSIVTLTNHKKSVRAMAVHPSEYTFCTGAADNVKVWKCPEGVFSRNITGHNSIINCLAIKDDGESSLVVAGSNNGQLHFWDWESGYKFQTCESVVQKGSLESEKGIFACAFDMSESRLITAECDKSIKIWIQDPDATPESHPIVWQPESVVKTY